MPFLHRCLRRSAFLLRLSAVCSLAASALPALAQVSEPPQWLPIEGHWCPADPKAATLPPPPSAAVPAACVALEVPRTRRQYSFGMQMRPPLPPGRGMWFAFRPARPARFWMHRTLHPLDMVFVSDGHVVAIQAAAPPCPRLPCPSYGPSEAIEGVLELGAGEAARLGLRQGSPLRVQLWRPPGPTAPAPD